MTLRNFILAAVAIAAVAALPLALWVWVVATHSPVRYADMFDRMDIPPDWELAHVEIRAPGIDACLPLLPRCPSITRYYLVDADPEDLFSVLDETLTDATVERDHGCQSNGPQDSVSCALGARASAGHLWVVVTDCGEGYVEKGARIGRDGWAIVRISAGAILY